MSEVIDEERAEAASGLDALNPVQRRTLAALARSGEPVEFDPAFVDELRAEVRVALDDVAARLEADEEVWVSKHRISSVLDCEEHHLQPDEFAWSAANAAGTIAHRAIELHLGWPRHRGEPTPIDLVEVAIERLADDTKGISEWLGALSPAEEADLRSRTTVRVGGFLESFPPIPRTAAPSTEASVRWPVSGPITLAGKVDLRFGRSRGRESRTVIVDLKTGRPHPRHRQDLAFYALLETLVREVPPRKVATFYLDACEAQVEDVSERMLVSAKRRTLDALDALVSLESEGRPPVRRPGSSCRWCPLGSTCADGIAHLAALDALP